MAVSIARDHRCVKTHVRRFILEGIPTVIIGVLIWVCRLLVPGAVID